MVAEVQIQTFAEKEKSGVSLHPEAKKLLINWSIMPTRCLSEREDAR